MPTCAPEAIIVLAVSARAAPSSSDMVRDAIGAPVFVCAVGKAPDDKFPPLRPGSFPRPISPRLSANAYREFGAGTDVISPKAMRISSLAAR